MKKIIALTLAGAICLSMMACTSAKPAGPEINDDEVIVDVGETTEENEDIVIDEPAADVVEGVESEVDESEADGSEAAESVTEGEETEGAAETSEEASDEVVAK